MHPVSPWHTNSSPPSPPAPALAPGPGGVLSSCLLSLRSQSWSLSEPGSTQRTGREEVGTKDLDPTVPVHPPPLPHTPRTAAGPTRCLPCVPPPKPAKTPPYPQTTPGAAPAAPAGTRGSGGLGPRRTQVQGGAAQGWALPTQPDKHTHTGAVPWLLAPGSWSWPHPGLYAQGAPEPRNLGAVGGKAASALPSREPPATAAGWVGGPRAPWTSGSNSI